MQYGPVLSRVKDLVPKNLIKAKGEVQVKRTIEHFSMSTSTHSTISTQTLYGDQDGR